MQRDKNATTPLRLRELKIPPFLNTPFDEVMTSPFRKQGRECVGAEDRTEGGCGQAPHLGKTLVVLSGECIFHLVIMVQSVCKHSCGIKVMQSQVFSYTLVVVEDATGSAHWVKDPVEYDLGWIF